MASLQCLPLTASSPSSSSSRTAASAPSKYYASAAAAAHTRAELSLLPSLQKKCKGSRQLAHFTAGYKCKKGRMRSPSTMKYSPSSSNITSGPSPSPSSSSSSVSSDDSNGQPSPLDLPSTSTESADNISIASLPAIERFIAKWQPPRYMWRAVAAFLICGQVLLRIVTGRIHWKNTLVQLAEVGPNSLGVTLLTAAFVGMVFTIQFVREFARLGLTRSVGGVLALALVRELSPAITSIIISGRVGSAFAAELGTMQVSEQTDTLRVLRTDPVDYLITPRVIACMAALPFLTVISFTVGMAASVLLADGVYGISSNIILDSAARALNLKDMVSTLCKSLVFGWLIAIISCTWGVTTLGGAKGVGESTTSAVVISLVCIFIADFILSWLFFQGPGDSLKAALG
eukprot:jgi/Chlat1/650/Chrsp103S00007